MLRLGQFFYINVRVSIFNSISEEAAMNMIEFRLRYGLCNEELRRLFQIGRNCLNNLISLSRSGGLYPGYWPLVFAVLNEDSDWVMGELKKERRNVSVAEVKQRLRMSCAQLGILLDIPRGDIHRFVTYEKSFGNAHRPSLNILLNLLIAQPAGHGAWLLLNVADKRAQTETDGWDVRRVRRRVFPHRQAELPHL